MNNKAMMDDFFDFIFTVFAAFFILLFLWLYVSSSQKNNEGATNIVVQRTEEVTGLINSQRIILENNNQIDIDDLQSETSEKRDLEEEFNN